MPARHGTDGAQWEAWTTELTAAVLGRRPPITWNGHGYGLRDEAGPPEPAGVHLAGDLCLEADLITRRKVVLPRGPCPGDLLVFAKRPAI
ncbi:hypothetical protein [Actinoplanes couchii]|uniref:Uncharacterized protein n=1 Tax=Actinoplanes couchii TaxID=403638 RepID=A0ABQ3XER7_9ACTN|nr:hypothetical protein [Actinoplanes couchii]MDR6319837.1 diaminopimelate decarboxylase [Actinoplanes couchii]GID56971.1 hypothetical protein Aco03nite_053750 [Actinoplanes couchii]